MPEGNGNGQSDDNLPVDEAEDFFINVMEVFSRYRDLKEREVELEKRIARLENENDELSDQNAEVRAKLQEAQQELAQTQQQLQQVADKFRNLQQYAQQIIPLGEPPYFPAIYMGLSDAVNHDRRENAIRQQFGVNPDVEQCWILMSNGQEQIANVHGQLVTTLERGQPVLLSQSRNVVAPIPEPEIARMVSLQEHTVSEVKDTGEVFIGGGMGRGSSPAIISPQLRMELGEDEGLTSGDRVLVFAGKCILRVLEKQELITTKEVREVDFSDVGGLDENIQDVKDLLGLEFNPEAMRLMDQEMARGAVFYGPPGNGKTLTASALANELGWEIEIIHGSEIMSKWVGETPRIMRESFNRAKEHEPALWVIDEADTILSTRGSSISDHKSGYVSQFTTLLDGMEDTSGVFVVLITNRMDQIDPAVIRAGRCDKKLEFTRPDTRERAREVLDIHFGHRIIAGDNPDETLEEVIDLILDDVFRKDYDTEIFVAERRRDDESFYFQDFISGSLLKTITDEITRNALKRTDDPNDSDFGIMKQDAEGVVAQAFTEEIPQDTKALNQWLRVNGYRPARNFKFKDWFVKRTN